MKIIMEGPDGGGKSTTLVKLQQAAVDAGEHPGLDHHGPYPGETNGQLYDHYHDSIANGNYMDRCWISEMIYSIVAREEQPRLSAQLMAQLDSLAWQDRYVVVLAVPPLDIVIDNWSQHGRTEYVEERRKIQRIYDWYWELASKPEKYTNMPTVHWDYTQEDNIAALRAKCIEIGRGLSSCSM